MSHRAFLSTIPLLLGIALGPGVARGECALADPAVLFSDGIAAILDADDATGTREAGESLRRQLHGENTARLIRRAEFGDVSARMDTAAVEHAIGMARRIADMAATGEVIRVVLLSTLPEFDRAMRTFADLEVETAGIPLCEDDKGAERPLSGGDDAAAAEPPVEETALENTEAGPADDVEAVSPAEAEADRLPADADAEDTFVEVHGGGDGSDPGGRSTKVLSGQVLAGNGPTETEDDPEATALPWTRILVALPVFLAGTGWLVFRLRKQALRDARRRAPRIPCDIEARIRLIRGYLETLGGPSPTKAAAPGGEDRPVRLADIGLHGVRISLDGTSLAKNGRVEIFLADGWHVARIVWSNDFFAGAEFETSLSQEDLDALLGRASRNTMRRPGPDTRSGTPVTAD